MAAMHSYSLTNRLFLISCLTALLLCAVSASAQDKIPDKNPLGFRSDFGLELSIGGHICVSGGGSGSKIECKGNNEGWSMGSGIAIAARVRPLKFFSIGLELSYMGLRPADASKTEELFKRFFDFSVGPVPMFHIPIRIRVVLLDISLGLKVAFVNGFLYAKPDKDVQANTGDTSNYYRHRLFGPEVSGIVGLDLFIVPKFAFGVEFRPMATMYQTVCFDDGSDEICRGAEDDPTTDNQYGTPFKIFFGLHGILYL
jgi:hypothetical protein